MSESVILCEGYHDRAFWAGWLERLGCTNLGRRSRDTGRIKVLDPWGDSVRNGTFAFESKSTKFVRITPCQGRDNVLSFAESRLKDREDRELVRLVLSVDSDVAVPGADPGKPTLSRQSLETLVRKFAEPETNEHGDLLLDDRATTISLVRWEAGDADVAGLPNQQTLERLVCAAVVAAYPPRGPAVKNWLDSRPQAPIAGPKEFAWSHMAGWYAEFGCEAFYRKIWLDDRVTDEMQSRLTDCGAWRVAKALAE